MSPSRFQQFNRPEKLFGLFTRLTVLPGVGDKLAKVLNKRVGEHVIDLLRHLPVGVVDRSQRPPVPSIEEGTVVTLEVTVTSHQKPRPRSRSPWRVITEADTGPVDIVYFHAKGDYVAKLLPAGSTRIVSGRAERYNNKVQIVHPDHVVAPEKADSLPRFEAVYPLTAGLTPRVLGRAMAAALERAPDLPEWIAPAMLDRFGWPSWQKATIEAHHPVKLTDLLAGSPARSRLAYDELLANQLALGLVRNASSRDRGRPFEGDGRLREALMGHLPFKLTGAQERVIGEISADQTSSHRMLRLVQGDVGSGKTVVALMAMLQVVECGSQAALLAPTEILARQHHATLSVLLKPMGIEPGLLLSRMKAADRKAVLAGLAAGEVPIVVGTHALLTETVEFRDLGLGVVDEQHRFGVRQRLVLGDKGEDADVLVMTATPIPRTLAMTAYGDLQSSNIDEKPEGRKPVKTATAALGQANRVIERLRQAISEGRQAYWICPLVDESDKLDIAAAEERHTMLSAALPDAKPELVHGRMDGEARDQAMERFRSGEARLLVATTVVEVGVDVPSASIRIIEHAERGGLAQMHPLRGRVGRGEEEASCLLLFKGPLSETAEARLSIMKESNDGFRIAEEDLKLRGPGELLGQRQSGDPDFVIADLAFHGDLLNLAFEQAEAILAADPELAGDGGEVMRLLLALFERDRAISYLAGG